MVQPLVKAKNVRIKRFFSRFFRALTVLDMVGKASGSAVAKRGTSERDWDNKTRVVIVTTNEKHQTEKERGRWGNRSGSCKIGTIAKEDSRSACQESMK
jgi:hypothetical protein